MTSNDPKHTSTFTLFVILLLPTREVEFLLLNEFLADPIKIPSLQIPLMLICTKPD